MRVALAAVLAAAAVTATGARSGSGSVGSLGRDAAPSPPVPGANLSPFQISARGTKPDVAVDAEGTAHVVWNEIVDGGADILHYCRIPRRSRSCVDGKTFVPPNGDDGNPRFNKDVAGPRVLITRPDQVTLLPEREPGVHTVDSDGTLDPQCFRAHTSPFCYSSGFADWAYVSQDDGATFSTPHIVSHVYLASGDATVVRVNDYSYLGIVGGFAESGFGVAYTQPPPTGYGRTPASLTAPNTVASEMSVAALHDDTPVVAYTDATGGSSIVHLRRYGGLGDPNTAAAWPPSLFVGSGRDPKVSAAGGDVYLLYRPGTGNAPYVLRRYDGNAVRDLGTVSDGGSVGQDALFVDDGGGVHAAWVEQVLSGNSHDELRYRYAPDGVNFTDATAIVRGAPLGIWYPRLGAADDGGGFAVFSTTQNGNGNIGAVPFGSQKKRTLIDVGVAAIELNQAVQTGTIPTRSGALGASNAVSYKGVTLAEYKTTVIRVYATARRALPPGESGAPATPTMTLRIVRNGKEIGPLLPDFQPSSLPVGPPTSVSFADRTSQTSAYEFTLPWQEATGTISRVAAINPLGLEPSIDECRICRDDTALRLDDIVFQPTTREAVYPVELTINGKLPAFSDPEKAFAATRAVTPFPIDVHPYGAVIDVSDWANVTSVTTQSCFVGVWPCTTSTRPATRADKDGGAQARVRDWATANVPGDTNDVIGIFADNNGIGGLTNGGPAFGGGEPVSIARDARPLTSIAHEFHHGIGRVHAGLACGGNIPDGAGEAWPPGNDGSIDGQALDANGNPYADSTARAVGIDARGSAPFRVIAAGAPGQPSTYYDFMSYCANTNESTAGGNKPDAWISIRNWQRALTFRRSPARATAGAGADVARIPASQPADAPTLRVQITAPLGEPPSIVNVAPDGGAPTPDQGNGYRLVTRDASGTLLATAGVVMEVQHDDGAPPSFDLTGRISAAGATAVQLVQGDRVVAGQLASPHAPVVRILAPRRGATIGGRAPVRIRWSATDQDHGSLVAIVEYSPDDGRSWRVVEVGPSHGEVRLPAALFPA